MTTSARQSAAKRLSAQAEIQNFCVRLAADSCAECARPLQPGKHALGFCNTCYKARRRLAAAHCCMDCGKLCAAGDFRRGLCHSCRQRKGAKPLPVQPRICKECHAKVSPKRWARGLCQSCYGHQRREMASVIAARQLEKHWRDVETASIVAARQLELYWRDTGLRAQYRTQSFIVLDREYAAYWREIGLAA